MKKSLFFTLIAVTLLGTVSCEQDPDTDKLDNDYLVYTNYDKNADFSSLSTFHIIDSILIIDDKEKPTYWNNQNSEKIIEAFAANLVERGYSATPFVADDVRRSILPASYSCVLLAKRYSSVSDELFLLAVQKVLPYDDGVASRLAHSAASSMLPVVQ